MYTCQERKSWEGEPVTERSGRAPPLSPERVLRAAVALADDAGIDALSMRRLAQDLGVVPMALYKHVASKDELLDGMVDVVIGEIDLPDPDLDWKTPSGSGSCPPDGRSPPSVGIG